MRIDTELCQSHFICVSSPSELSCPAQECPDNQLSIGGKSPPNELTSLGLRLLEVFPRSEEAFIFWVWETFATDGEPLSNF